MKNSSRRNPVNRSEFISIKVLLSFFPSPNRIESEDDGVVFAL